MEKIAKDLQKLDPEERKKLKALLSEKSKSADSKVDWLYKSAKPDSEEFLTGRKIDSNYKADDEVETPAPSGVGALFDQDAVVRNAKKDMEVKMREDPLFAIRKKEEEARRKLLNNPVKMKRLQEAIKEKKEKKKKIKKSKKEDDVLLKYLSIMKEKGDKKVDIKSLKKLAEVDSDSDSQDSAEDERMARGAERLRDEGSSRGDRVRGWDSGRGHRQGNNNRDTDSEDDRRAGEKQRHMDMRLSREQEDRHRGRDEGRSYKDRRDYKDRNRSRDNERGRERVKGGDMDRGRGDERRRERERGDDMERVDGSERRRDIDRFKGGDRERHWNGEGRVRDGDSEKARGHNQFRSDQRRGRGGSYDDRRDRKFDQSQDSQKKNKHQRSSCSEDEETRLHPKLDKNDARTSSGAMKKQRHDSSSSSSDSDQSSGGLKRDMSKGYGLLLPKGKTAPPRRKSRSRSPVGQQRVPAGGAANRKADVKRERPAPKKKLSAEEMERRRREMMEDAVQRDEQRMENVKRYSEEDRKEIDENSKQGKSADFLNPLMAKHNESSSVEDRIRRNRFNIQRTSNDLEKNFARK